MFHLGGLMVLKGIGFGLFLLFFHQMVLKWSAVIANGLQMCSISPVDSAIGCLRHVRMTAIQDFSYSSSHWCQGPVPCFFGKNSTCSLTLRTHRSLALWALSNCSFCLSWISMSLCWIWYMLIGLDGLERTAPCVGCPWSISDGEGRSAEMGVSHSWSNALTWAFGDPSVFL